MPTVTKNFSVSAAFMFGFLAAGCGSDDTGSKNPSEVITTLTLSFTPTAGGAAIVASVNDADGDGGNPPTITPVSLAVGAYDMTLKFENRLAMPTVDTTLEIRDESSQHQIFFTGTAVSGPANSQKEAPLVHVYGDMDAKGLPVGLSNKITAVAGTGMLTVTLRHMPPVNTTPAKTAAAAETVRSAMRFTTLGGSTDLQVTFPVSVQ